LFGVLAAARESLLNIETDKVSGIETGLHKKDQPSSVAQFTLFKKA
jgi:hypothetical protein